MSKPAEKPVISIKGCEQSAWRLIVRAKNALVYKRWKRADLDLFAFRAGQHIAAQYPEWNTPIHVYNQAIAAVREVCTINFDEQEDAA